MMGPWWSLPSTILLLTVLHWTHSFQTTTTFVGRSSSGSVTTTHRVSPLKEGTNSGDRGGGGGNTYGGDDPVLNTLMDLLGNGMVTMEVEDGNGGGGGNNGDDGPPPVASSQASDDCLEAIATFDLKPKEVVQYLDRFVIRQYDAKKVLAVAICDHYNHCRRCLQNEEIAESKRRDGSHDIDSLFTSLHTESTEYAKPNVLLTGPTGVGKTYLLRCLARLVGVPFVKADATKFSETGIVGRDAEDLVRDLVDAVDGNTTLASMGIIYVDEVDKICGGGGEGSFATSSSFNKRGVQNNLLKLLEETEVSLERPEEMRITLPAALGGSDNGGAARSINTRNILFIFSGAFTDLDKDIRRRREKKPFGIEINDSPPPSSSPRTNGGYDNYDEDDDYDRYDEYYADDDPNRPAGKGRSYLRYATTADFVKAGLEPEFVGRVPVRVALDDLLPSDLLQILTSSEGSVLKQFIRDFQEYGIDMDAEADTDALREIAERAGEEGTGARGLVTVLERTLREHKFELPSTSIDRFVLDVDTVRRPRVALARLLESETAGEAAGVRLEDIKRWETKLHRAAGLPEEVRVWLTEEAQNYMIIESIEKDVSAYSLAGQLFGDALGKVVARVYEATGQRSFPISMKMCKNPEEELRQWVGALDKGTKGAEVVDVEVEEPNGEKR